MEELFAHFKIKLATDKNFRIATILLILFLPMTLIIIAGLSLPDNSLANNTNPKLGWVLLSSPNSYHRMMVCDGSTLIYNDGQIKDNYQACQGENQSSNNTPIVTDSGLREDLLKVKRGVDKAKSLWHQMTPDNSEIFSYGNFWVVTDGKFAVSAGLLGNQDIIAGGFRSDGSYCLQAFNTRALDASSYPSSWSYDSRSDYIRRGVCSYF